MRHSTVILLVPLLYGAAISFIKFDAYPTYSEINQQIESFQQRCPEIVERVPMEPKSIEGRDIYAVKFSGDPGINNNKPQTLIIGVQHAEEPIGAAVIEYTMDVLCDTYGTDPEITWLVDNRQIFFVPVANPDGYVYLEPEGGPGWRGNRRVNDDGSIGVDLNRNFPFKWAYDDRNSSPTPGSFTYRGKTPASEPETQAMMKLVNDNRFRTWQNHHSANDVLEYPWDYDYEVKLPEQHLNAYLAICDEQLALYRFTECGPSYVVYNGWAPNGGTVDWGHSDSATYQIYTMITELGESLWESPAEVESIVQEMSPADLYMAQAAGFFPVIRGFTLNDDCSFCTDDGILNPGESVALTVDFHNKSVVDTTLNVKSTLRSSNPSVNIVSPQSDHGSILYLEDFDNSSTPFGFYLDQGLAAGTDIELEVVMTWKLNSVSYEKVLPISFETGPDTLTNVPIRPGKSAGGTPLISGISTGGGIITFELTRPLKHGELNGLALEIYNPRGLVASVSPQSKTNLITWRGTDNSGTRVGPGVFIARLMGPGINQSLKFSWLGSAR